MWGRLDRCLFCVGRRNDFGAVIIDIHRFPIGRRGHGDRHVGVLFVLPHQQGIERRDGLVAHESPVPLFRHHIVNSQQDGRMVVTVGSRGRHQLLAFFLIRGVLGDDIDKFVIPHPLHHSIGAHIKIVSRLDVGDVYDIRPHAILLSRHHRPRDDVFLFGSAHLGVRDFPCHVKFHHQGMVLRLIEHSALVGPDVIDTAVADMGSEASPLMETKESQRRPHFLHGIVSIILLVETLAGKLKSRPEQVVRQHFPFLQTRMEIMRHFLGDDTAGHLAFIMSSHPVAEDEEALIPLRMGGIDEIFLVGPLSNFEDDLGLAQSYSHLREDFCKKINFDEPNSTSARSLSTTSSPCPSSTPLTKMGFLFW